MNGQSNRRDDTETQLKKKINPRINPTLPRVNKPDTNEPNANKPVNWIEFFFLIWNPTTWILQPPPSVFSRVNNRAERCAGATSDFPVHLTNRIRNLLENGSKRSEVETGGGGGRGGGCPPPLYPGSEVCHCYRRVQSLITIASSLIFDPLLLGARIFPFIALCCSRGKMAQDKFTHTDTLTHWHTLTHTHTHTHTQCLFIERPNGRNGRIGQ